MVDEKLGDYIARMIRIEIANEQRAILMAKERIMALERAILCVDEAQRDFEKREGQ